MTTMLLQLAARSHRRSRTTAAGALPTLLLTLAVSAISSSAVDAMAATDTVFRCGNAYTESQVPCAAGKAVNVDDARSDSQRAAARDVAARDAALAARMTRDRQLAEATVTASSRSGGGSKATSTKVRADSKTTQTANRRCSGKRAAANCEGKDFVAYIPKPAKQKSTAAQKSR